MRILFLAHRVPFPPNKGDKIRSFHILEHLKQNHDVHVVFPLHSERERKDADALRDLGYSVSYQSLNRFGKLANTIRFGLKRKPLSLGSFWSNRLNSKIRTLMQYEQFDAIFVFSSTMAEYVKSENASVKIIDFCDLDSAKFTQFSSATAFPMSLLFRLEGKLLSVYEKTLFNLFDYILLISPEERKLYKVDDRAGKIKIMSNGASSNFSSKDMDDPSVSVQTPHIVFTGVMDYLPNVDAVVWFATHVFPHLRKLYPDLSFYIVGSKPTHKVRALHDPKNGIIVTGFVDKVEPYLKDAVAFVAPVRIARGMQTKILEAMALGIPVVSSRQSARGIGAESGKELLAADEPAEYIKHISTLKMDASYRQSLVQHAEHFLSENFNWQKNLSILDELLIAKRPALPLNIKLKNDEQVDHVFSVDAQKTALTFQHSERS